MRGQTKEYSGYAATKGGDGITRITVEQPERVLEALRYARLHQPAMVLVDDIGCIDRTDELSEEVNKNCG